MGSVRCYRCLCVAQRAGCATAQFLVHLCNVQKSLAMLRKRARGECVSRPFKTVGPAQSDTGVCRTVCCIVAGMEHDTYTTENTTQPANKIHACISNIHAKYMHACTHIASAFQFACKRNEPRSATCMEKSTTKHYAYCTSVRVCE